MSGGRPPKYPPGHPLASPYIKAKYGDTGELDPSTSTLATPSPDDPEFRGAQFVAFMVSNSLKFDKAGNLHVEFVVQAGNVDSALALHPLIKQVQPVELSVTQYQPFVNRAEEIRARLRAVD